MKTTAAKLLTQALFLCVLASIAFSQDNSGTLSGEIKDTSGKPLAGVSVSVRNLNTGQTFDAQSDASGHYRITKLPSGEYEVVSSSNQLGATTSRVSVTAGGEQEWNITLQGKQSPSPSANLPNAPTANKDEPTLEDLGFSRSEAEANAREQALLDKRSHMLKIHQRMGLITTIPMIASVITSLQAGGKKEGSATRDLHVALGALTGDLYGITAYYAIRAPKIKGTETRGPIKVHKILAWIHGPGMIATPILGAIAFQQKNNGQRVHGIAQAHGPVAIVTAGAFGAALLSVSLKF